MSNVKEMFVKYNAATVAIQEAKVAAEELVREAINKRTDITDEIVAKHGSVFELEDGKIVKAFVRKLTNKKKKELAEDEDDGTEAGADAPAEEAEPEVVGHMSFFKSGTRKPRKVKEPKAPKPEKPKPVKVG
jgi:hypothetical protein